MLLLASALLFTLAASHAAAPEGASDPLLLSRPVVVGASISSGFGQSKLTARSFGFGELLGLALEAPHGEVRSFADVYAFMDVGKRSRNSVELALKADPTILFAVDFLFWFGYGEPKSAQQRLALLEEGLGMLARFTCPIVIGDFPDVSLALKGKTPFGPTIRKEQIPTQETRAMLNERVRLFAKQHQHVIVVPLDAFVTSLHAGETFEVRGQQFGGGNPRDLLQADLLHPTLDSFIAIALLTLDVVERALESLAPEHVRWNRGDLLERVMTATLEAREKRAERELKRQQRKARREERRRAAEEREREPVKDGGR